MELIKDQLFKICIECLDEIAHSKSNHSIGTPPTVFYIDFGVGSRCDIENLDMIPQETYRYENGVMERVETGTMNATRPVDRMYFPKGYGLIGVLEDNSYAYVSYVVGPRFGEGFRYKILNDEEGLRLGYKELVWIS